jgi:hypothetical protein
MGDLVGQLRDLQTNGDAWGLLDLTPAVIAEIETLRAELQAAQAALVRQAGIMHRFGDKPHEAP